ncbi:MAG: sigma-70 family RNA polymerase sigma factor [Clostridia bacterium]
MSECLTKLADGEQREHYGLAVYCAKRFFGRGVPREELIAEAEAALLWAASRFDAQRGARFSSYAIPFVLGALRELCAKAAPMHVPRTDMRLLCAAERARVELRARDGREPTIAELGAAVGAEPIRLSAMLAAKERMQSASGGEAAQERARDCEDNAGFEDSVLLKDTIMRLGRPLAQVLWLRFGVGFSQAEVAARLGVSQSQLSRWEQRGKDALRQALEGTV